MTEHDAKYKKTSDAFVALVGIIAAANSFSKQEFDPRFLVALVGLWVSLRLVHIIYTKRNRSFLLADISGYQYSYSQFQRCLALTGIVIVAFLCIAFWFCYLPKPVIEKLIPPYPIAGDDLQIFGKNLSGKAGVELAFDDVNVREYVKVGKDFIEVRVPQTAKAGPLFLKSKSYISLANRDLFYPIIAIQDKINRFQLITEDIRSDGDLYKIKFLALNNGSSPVTISAIQLRVVAVKNLQVNFIKKRIDLDTLFFIEKQPVPPSKKKVDLFHQHRVDLLDDRYVIQLNPKDPNFFLLNLSHPEGQHHVKLVFAIVMYYRDNANGSSGHVFSNQFFSLESGDLVGMKSNHDLPFNNDSILKLQQEYVSDFITDSLKP